MSRLCRDSFAFQAKDLTG